MIGKEKVSDEIMCDYLSKALSKMKILDDNGWQKGKSKIFLRDAQVILPLPLIVCFCANLLYSGREIGGTASKNIHSEVHYNSEILEDVFHSQILQAFEDFYC